MDRANQKATASVSYIASQSTSCGSHDGTVSPSVAGRFSSEAATTSFAPPQPPVVVNLDDEDEEEEQEDQSLWGNENTLLDEDEDSATQSTQVPPQANSAANSPVEHSLANVRESSLATQASNSAPVPSYAPVPAATISSFVAPVLSSAPTSAATISSSIVSSALAPTATISSFAASANQVQSGVSTTFSAPSAALFSLPVPLSTSSFVSSYTPAPVQVATSAVFNFYIPVQSSSYIPAPSAAAPNFVFYKDEPIEIDFEDEPIEVDDVLMEAEIPCTPIQDSTPHSHAQQVSEAPPVDSNAIHAVQLQMINYLAALPAFPVPSHHVAEVPITPPVVRLYPPGTASNCSLNSFAEWLHNGTSSYSKRSTFWERRQTDFELSLKLRSRHVNAGKYNSSSPTGETILSAVKIVSLDASPCASCPSSPVVLSSEVPSSVAVSSLSQEVHPSPSSPSSPSPSATGTSHDESGRILRLAASHLKVALKDYRLVKDRRSVHPYQGLSRTQFRLIRALKGRTHKENGNFLDGIQDFLAACSSCDGSENLSAQVPSTSASIPEGAREEEPPIESATEVGTSPQSVEAVSPVSDTSALVEELPQDKEDTSMSSKKTKKRRTVHDDGGVEDAEWVSPREKQRAARKAERRWRRSLNHREEEEELPQPAGGNKRRGCRDEAEEAPARKKVKVWEEGDEDVEDVERHVPIADSLDGNKFDAEATPVSVGEDSQNATGTFSNEITGRLEEKDSPQFPMKIMKLREETIDGADMGALVSDDSDDDIFIPGAMPPTPDEDCEDAIESMLKAIGNMLWRIWS